MFKCLNNSNKENIITIQGARATDAINPFASIVFQNYYRETSLTYNMVSISCLDHFGDNSNNGSGDLIFKTSYTGGSNLQEQMRILYNGNVVIGTTFTNTYKLNVDGGINALGYCNLLIDSVSNDSIHHAPTSRALRTVASTAEFASNSLASNGTWSSNTAFWSSNTAAWASNSAMFGSNLLLDTYWMSNNAMPWTSNTSVYASNTSTWASNTAFYNSNAVIFSSNTSIWASNIAQTAYDASMFASNIVIMAYWTSNATSSNTTSTEWLSNTITPLSSNVFWLSNTQIPFVLSTSTYGSNTAFWLSNEVVPPLFTSTAFSSNCSSWLSNNGLPSIQSIATYASNTTDWLSNNLIVMASYAYSTTSWLSNTSLPFVSNCAVYASNVSSWASNTSFWASNTSSYNSNISSWLSNDIISEAMNNANFGSNTSSWLSNISIPITSNIATFGSNTVGWLSNVVFVWSSNTLFYNSNVVDFLSNNSLPWTSNASVYSSNTTSWLSNTKVPILTDIADFGSNTSSWLSNISIPITSNIAVFGSNTSSWLSNTAIVWASNTATSASNKAFATWSNSSSNVYIGANSNVGIGVTSPTFPLEVQGTIKTTSLLTEELQVVGNMNSPIDNLIALKSLNPIILDASLSNTSYIFGGSSTAVFDSNIEAWRFVNDSNMKFISWNFLTNSDSSNTLYRYKNLRTAYFKIRFNAEPSNDTYPFISFYSHPLSGAKKTRKDATIDYRANMKYYTLTQSNFQIGKDYCFYVNDDPSTTGFLNIVCDRKIKVQFSSNDNQAYIGPSNETRIQDTDILEFINVETNSSAPINTCDFTMTEVGYRFGTEVARYITCFSSN